MDESAVHNVRHHKNLTYSVHREASAVHLGWWEKSIKRTDQRKHDWLIRWDSRSKYATNHIIFTVLHLAFVSSQLIRSWRSAKSSFSISLQSCAGFFLCVLRLFRWWKFILAIVCSCLFFGYNSLKVRKTLPHSGWIIFFWRCPLGNSFGVYVWAELFFFPDKPAISTPI